jgi:hypothetical protein
MPESDPSDVGFVRVIRAYHARPRKLRGQLEQDVKTEFREEREYRVGTQRGQFQLWIDCKYTRAIPSEMMVMPESDPIDVKFVRVIKVYYVRPRKLRRQDEKDVKTEVHEEREYRLGTNRGQFQLWINGKYNSDITSIMKEKISREQLTLSWLDDKPPELPKSDSQNRGGIVRRKARVEALLNQLAEFT